jgi:hypothetical protein
MENNRRSFLQAVVVLGGAGALGVGCGGESPVTDTGVPGTDTGTPGTDTGVPGTDTGVPGSDAGSDAGGGGGCASPTPSIGTNHGHSFTVSAADVTAGTERTYDIMGTSLHTHSVTLTPANFATLATGASVMVTTSTGGAHTHMVTVSCG